MVKCFVFLTGRTFLPQRHAFSTVGFHRTGQSVKLRCGSVFSNSRPLVSNYVRCFIAV